MIETVFFPFLRRGELEIFFPPPPFPFSFLPSPSGCEVNSGLFSRQRGWRRLASLLLLPPPHHRFAIRRIFLALSRSSWRNIIGKTFPTPSPPRRGGGHQILSPFLIGPEVRNGKRGRPLALPFLFSFPPLSFSPKEASQIPGQPSFSALLSSPPDVGIVKNEI